LHEFNLVLYFDVVQLLKSIVYVFSKPQTSSLRTLGPRDKGVPDIVYEPFPKEIYIPPHEIWECMGKSYSQCACGSKFVTVNPGQAYALEPGEYDSEFWCNQNCGRDPEDECSYCSITQVHTGGGNTETKHECKHRSEAGTFFTATLYANNKCWKECIPRLSAQLERKGLQLYP
jgi:hypothetical protein